jgi:hypothetical protein
MRGRLFNPSTAALAPAVPSSRLRLRRRRQGEPTPTKHLSPPYVSHRVHRSGGVGGSLPPFPSPKPSPPPWHSSHARRRAAASARRCSIHTPRRVAAGHACALSHRPSGFAEGSRGPSQWRSEGGLQVQRIAPARRLAAPFPLMALVVDAWPSERSGRGVVLLTRAWGGRAHAVKALPEAAAAQHVGHVSSPSHHVQQRGPAC